MTKLLVTLLLLCTPAAFGQIRVTISPSTPWIEQTETQQYLNCDFILQNAGSETLVLQVVQVSVYDPSGKLAVRRFVNDNGPSPSILTIPKREITSGGKVIVFNPFFAYEPAVPLHRLVYEFKFRSAADKEREVTTEVSFSPKPWTQKNKLTLPLKGRFIVWDGHDFYAHHRRWDTTHPLLAELGMNANPGRYAYDFSPVDESGKLFRTDGKSPQDWLGFGAPLYAPAGGTVVEAEGARPDSGGSSLDFGNIKKNPKLLFGNYVLLDHGDGTFSLLCHMEQGSVRLKRGDKVRRGDQLGRMGFSGDAITVHLHYQVQDGPGMNAEGIPSYFSDFRRVLGSRSVMVKTGVVDSGDIIEQ